MDLFHIIDDGAAILRQKGRYTQKKIYRRGDKVYAEADRSSFIELLKGNGTSDPNISWMDVAGRGVTVEDRRPQWVDPEDQADEPKTRKLAKKPLMTVVKA